jgi:hypothetical protein
MGRRQSQMFRIPQRRSARSSGSGLGFVGAVFAAFLLLLGIGFLVQFLQSPSGWVFILVALVVAFFVWRKNNQEKQRHAWLIWQQQQACAGYLGHPFGKWMTLLSISSFCWELCPSQVKRYKSISRCAGYFLRKSMRTLQFGYLAP